MALIYRIWAPDHYHYYFGSTKNLTRRWSRHKLQLSRAIHRNRYMLNVYNLQPIGWNIESIEETPVDTMYIVEQRYLDQHYGQPGCMNLQPIVQALKSTKGYKFTPEQLTRLRESAQARGRDPAIRQKISNTLKSLYEQGKLFIPTTLGYKHTPRALELIRSSAKLREQKKRLAVTSIPSYTVSNT